MARKANNRSGEKYITNEGYEVKIINCKDRFNCDIEFEGGLVLTRAFKEIQNGAVKNPYHKAVFGVGYIGVGKYSATVAGQMTPAYQIWHGLI